MEKKTVSIPMSDPRHPMHENRRTEELDRLYGKFEEKQLIPAQYEDQYGRLRWTHDQSPVNP